MSTKRWDIEVASVSSSGDLETAGTATPANGVIFPSSDPGIAGAWWDNAGTLTKSAG